MADTETKHVPGQMDITEQERTYTGFVKGAFYLAGFCFLVLVFLALFNT